MINLLDKRILNFIVIAILTTVTFVWSFYIFKLPYNFLIIFYVVLTRFLCSFFIFNDYSQSWSRLSNKSFLIKSMVYIIAFLIYMPFLYGTYRVSFILSELFCYLFLITFLMYLYNYFINKNSIVKTKKVVIYGAGNAGAKIQSEFYNSEYQVKYFCDDNKVLQGRSIDGIVILSFKKLELILNNEKFDLLLITMPSAKKIEIKNIHSKVSKYFTEVKVLPSFENIFKDQNLSKQLKNISLEDLLARERQNLDDDKISKFINNKTILVTGAGGSIGSELVRQCRLFNANKIILLDHSEFNLYKIEQEMISIVPEIFNANIEIVTVMQSVVNIADIEKTFNKYEIDIVIHAAAYKHVPLVESNIKEAVINNIIGTKNIIDIAIKHGISKVILISTDKAVRPTNVMGATKRICELYAQNINSFNTEIVAVRFGNVLGSSGSVIPKFKMQIEKNQNITVTHPDITRYFMLIPEACHLVLQAGSLGSGGEIFILDMGEPIKILDLANKMISISQKDLKIDFCGLRPGEKLYEELLLDDSDINTDYDSITIAKKTDYKIENLQNDIKKLVSCTDENQILKQLKYIVVEFEHNKF